MVDLVVIHPGAAHGIYGELGNRLTALEPPLWSRLISGYIRKRGWDVKIIDAEAEGWGPKQVAQKVQELDPSLVCIAVYGHQPSASTQQMVSAREIASALGKIGSAIIMVGGHVAALPARTLWEEPVSYACNGEGPVTIEGLLQYYKGRFGASLLKIPGLVYWDGADKPISNPPAPLIEDLSEFGDGSWDDLPMEKYRAHNWQCFGDLAQMQPYASIYTSLGCPHACVFCCIHAPFNSRRYRMRDPKEVITEIKYLYEKYQVRTFKIIDELFVLNEKHYTTIARGIVDAGLGDKINIWAYARVDTVREGHLALLRAAGIQWLALGIESGSKYVRDGAQKRLKNDDIAAVVKSVQDAGINVIGNYIFGLPDDNRITMQETLDLALELNTEFMNAYVAMAYPGSPLYKEALEKGWILPETWRGYSQHNDDCRPLDTQHISGAEVLAFRDQAFITYFSSDRYQTMIREKFGEETLVHVQEMLRYRLPRKLVAAA